MEKPSKAVKIIFNPFDTVIEAYESLFDKPCELHFALSDSEESFGFTEFLETGGSTPVVVIDPQCSIVDSVEILAHELAHVAVGIGCIDHGEEWEKAFAAIHERYTILVNKDVPEGFIVSSVGKVV